jgi:hypothetical protein
VTAAEDTPNGADHQHPEGVTADTWAAAVLLAHLVRRDLAALAAALADAEDGDPS